jgi:two-component system, NarL family, response regulator NreC
MTRSWSSAAVELRPSYDDPRAFGAGSEPRDLTPSRIVSLHDPYPQQADSGRDRDEKTIRVALVEDHHLVREGLRLVLTERGIEVVGESPTAEGVFDLTERTKPDVVLLDLSLAETDGITVLRELRARAPNVKVIVLTMHRDPETVRQALRAGAAGYVVKGAHSADLHEAIAAVVRGERYVHSSIAGIVVDDSLRWLASDTVLTPREREILGLLAGGARPSDIGRRLGISTHTVRRHIANLSSKLGTRGTPALVSYAIREGVVREGSN